MSARLTTAATLLLLPIVMGVQCGCGPIPVHIYTVAVECVEGCASKLEVLWEDTRDGISNGVLWCDYLWRESAGVAEWAHPFRALVQPSGAWRCSMPYGQTADLSYFYDAEGIERVLSVSLTEPIREGAR